MAALLEVRKGQAGVRPADLVYVGRGIPAQENFPVVPGDATRCSGMEQDVRGAVGSQRIVEGWLLNELIDLSYIVQKQTTRPFWRDAGAIQIDLLVRLPIRRAQANHIAFVSDHVDELILLEKPLDRRVVLCALFASLNGDGDIVLFAKAKAHQQVRNGIPRPVGADQVYRLQLLQIERLVVIPRGEIRFRTVHKVTDVVQGNAVA